MSEGKSDDPAETPAAAESAVPERTEDAPPETAIPEGAATEFAAEEPTAMWNEDLLRQSGVLDESHYEEGPSKSAPVQIEAQRTPGKGEAPKGLSWAVVAVLAVGLGAAAFFAIRALKS